MLHGIIAASIASAAWIAVQNLLMAYRPAEARLRAMAIAFFSSLPLLFAVEAILPVEVPQTESPWMGLLHALIVHTLIFLCYAECFYHVERSVTFRLLVELLPYQKNGATIDDIRTRYSQDGMIASRLAVLERSGFVRRHGEMWELTRAGRVYAAGVEALSRLFRSKSQADRS